MNRASDRPRERAQEHRHGEWPARARRGHARALTKDEKLINEVEGVAETVGDFVGGISRLQTIVVLRTDYQFLSSTVKSYVELRLQPREGQVLPDPGGQRSDGLTRYEQIDVDTTNTNEPPHYREVRTVTSNSFRFSLQFAQSSAPSPAASASWSRRVAQGSTSCSFRTASSSGRISFGFGEVVVPRWRISLGYEFVNRVWLLGGVDDILSDSRRDYFVGLQLKFNDEDLKTILPFTPGSFQ